MDEPFGQTSCRYATPGGPEDCTVPAWCSEKKREREREGEREREIDKYVYRLYRY